MSSVLVEIADAQPTAEEDDVGGRPRDAWLQARQTAHLPGVFENGEFRRSGDRLTSIIMLGLCNIALAY